MTVQQDTHQWLLERLGQTLEEIASEWIEEHAAEVARRSSFREATGMMLSNPLRAPQWSYLPQALQAQIDTLREPTTKMRVMSADGYGVSTVKVPRSVLDQWGESEDGSQYLYVITPDESAPHNAILVQQQTWRKAQQALEYFAEADDDLFTRQFQLVLDLMLRTESTQQMHVPLTTKETARPVEAQQSERKSSDHQSVAHPFKVDLPQPSHRCGRCLTPLLGDIPWEDLRTKG